MKNIFCVIGCLCAVSAYGFELKSGDLLFQVGRGSGFEQAVEASTSGRDQMPFTHVGIAVREGKNVWIWEAHPDGGVRRTPPESFLSEAAQRGGRPVVSVFRLKRKYRRFIPAAVKRLYALEGKGYDFLFLPENDAYYCSELVQAVFGDGNGSYLFPSAPMSFADKRTGQTAPFWTEYFQRRGKSVPEGVPGTNPGDLSKSDKLKAVFRFF